MSIDDLTPYKLSYNSVVNTPQDDPRLHIFTDPLFCRVNNEVAVKVDLHVRFYRRAWGTAPSSVHYEQFICQSPWVCEAVFNRISQKAIEVFGVPLDMMPLLINGTDHLINNFVKWRLEHGI